MTTVAIYSYEDRLGAHRHKVGPSRPPSFNASRRPDRRSLSSFLPSRAGRRGVPGRQRSLTRRGLPRPGRYHPHRARAQCRHDPPRVRPRRAPRLPSSSLPSDQLSARSESATASSPRTRSLPRSARTLVSSSSVPTRPSSPASATRRRPARLVRFCRSSSLSRAQGPDRHPTTTLQLSRTTSRSFPARLARSAPGRTPRPSPRSTASRSSSRPRSAAEDAACVSSASSLRCRTPLSARRARPRAPLATAPSSSSVRPHGSLPASRGPR
jgi:hypothetical protein